VEDAVSCLGLPEQNYVVAVRVGVAEPVQVEGAEKITGLGVRAQQGGAAQERP